MNNERELIEKLAIEHCVWTNSSDGYREYIFDNSTLKAFAEAYARATLQAEPVAYLVQRFSEGMHEKDEYFSTKEQAYENARWGYNETKVTPLYTHAPNTVSVAEDSSVTVPVEKYNKLLDALKNLHWACSERDKKNRIRLFDEIMEEAIKLIAEAEGKEG